MRVLQVYNQYRSLFGGEETVVLRTEKLIKKNGGEARLAMRSSRGLDSSIQRKMKVFLSGIYNPFSFKEIAKIVKDFRPDLVHVHNLNPLYSPSVLVGLKKLNIPIVLTVHNHFHTCPTANHLYKGKICERCVGGREYHCLFQNCRGNVFESFGYAARSYVARVFRLYTSTVTVVIALNEFARQRLLMAGFRTERVVVLPNAVDIPDHMADAATGGYAVYSGRMCPEKGVATLIRAAWQAPEVLVRLLGGGPTLEEHKRDAPPNATFLGQVSAESVKREYRGARFLVVPSRWFEGCPLVILEAMAHGLPVVASRIGGLPELVENGVTGLLFEPGNDEELAQQLERLWRDPGLCASMGSRARKQAVLKYGEEGHWKQLRSIYRMALENAKRNRA